MSAMGGFWAIERDRASDGPIRRLRGNEHLEGGIQYSSRALLGFGPLLRTHATLPIRRFWRSKRTFCPRKQQLPDDGVLTGCFSFTGPGPPSPRVRPDLQAQEDGPACVWRLKMRQLRPGPHRPGLPHRGAKDCQEGAEGAEPGREEEINELGPGGRVLG